MSLRRGDEPLPRQAAVARFRDLYDRQYDDLWKYCLRRSASPEQAEDVMSEVFAIAWRRLDEIPVDGERPWLFVVARNLMQSSWRGRARQNRLVARLQTRRPAVSMELAPPSDTSEVLQAIESLSPKDREVLQLVIWDQLPRAEVAAIMGCDEKAVAVRLHRARQRLRKKLERMQYQDDTEHVAGKRENGS